MQKRIIYKSVVEPWITYGADIWIMNTNLSSRINQSKETNGGDVSVFTSLDHIRNERIREIMDIEV